MGKHNWRRTRFLTLTFDRGHRNRQGPLRRKKRHIYGYDDGHGSSQILAKLLDSGEKRERGNSTMRPEINSNDFVFFGIGWQIRIRFCRCGKFFERFEFLVCSKFNHTQCCRTCACAVACLCPQNSNSNVVASLTIDDNMYIYIYVRCRKKHETIVEGQKHFHVRRHVHFHTHTRTHTYTYTYTYWWRRKRREETNRTMSQLIPSAVSTRIAETEQLHEA